MFDVGDTVTLIGREPGTYDPETGMFFPASAAKDIGTQDVIVSKKCVTLLHGTRPCTSYQLKNSAWNWVESWFEETTQNAQSVDVGGLL